MKNPNPISSTEPEGIDPALDRFASRLRERLPRLHAERMQRVEQAFQAELNRTYPPAPLPLRTWSHWVAAAAMLLLTIGLAWHVSRVPSGSSSRDIVAATPVIDQFEIVIEIDERGLSEGDSQNAWNSLFQAIDRYASLFGLDRLTRR